VDAGGATSATTTATAAGRRTKGVHGFGQSIHDVKFPSRFLAPTNVPRYNGDTNPRVWLEDYRRACHAGGAMDDLFVIKNLPL
jgi:hypothetical protein